MKKIFKVKAIQKIAAIIALVAVIGFSMLSCDDNGGGKPDNGETPLPNPHGTESKDFPGFYYVEEPTYDDIFTGGIVITFYDEQKGGMDVTIPSEINGKPVTEIGYQAFLNSNITSVTVPDSVTTIGDEVFLNCTNLESVTIGNSVTEIRCGTFRNCTSLTSITIPDSVTSIGYVAFDSCTNLESVTIGNSVTEIDGSAFSNCTNLATINVDAANIAFCSQDGILYNKEKTEFICIPKGITGNVTIPDSITSIGTWDFQGCASLNRITISDSVTEIPSSAFKDCTSLTSVTIGDSVTNIRQYAFDGCTSLIDITIPNGITSIEIGTFSGCTSLISITIPDNVKSIYDEAFKNCTSLTSITIGSGVTSLGTAQDPFSRFGCINLAAINVDDANTVFSSQDGILYDKEKTYIREVPKGITGAVTIPDSVISISGYDFMGCSKLTAINIDPDNEKYSSWDGVLYNKDQTTLIAFPASWWVVTDGAKFRFGISDNVTNIGDFAFYGCTCLAGVTIPNSVTQIGRQAFNNCTNLISIIFQGTIPSSGFVNIDQPTFLGNLRDKYLSEGIGAYITEAPVNENSKWWGINVSSVSGVYVCDGYKTITLNNGSFTYTFSDFGSANGTYTISGEAIILTVTAYYLMQPPSQLTIIDKNTLYSTSAGFPDNWIKN